MKAFAFALAAAAVLMAGQAGAAIVTYVANARSVSAIHSRYFYDDVGNFLGTRTGNSPKAPGFDISIGVDVDKIEPRVRYDLVEVTPSIIKELNGEEASVSNNILYGHIEFDESLDVTDWWLNYFDRRYINNIIGYREVSAYNEGLSFSDTFEGRGYFSPQYSNVPYWEIVTYRFDYIRTNGEVWGRQTPAPVPLPAAAPLLLAGTAALYALGRRQRVTDR